MNTWKIGRVFALALPMVLAAACGGTDTGADGGDAGANVCPGVASVYAIVAGTYTISSATVTTDGCNTGVTAAALMGGTRLVANDSANGNIIVCGSGAATCAPGMGNGVELGEGAVRCNAGTLTYSGPVVDGNCSYTIDRTSTIAVTAKDQFTLTFTETQSAHMSCDASMADGCMTSFSITMSM